MEHGIRRISLTPKQREQKIAKDAPKITKYRELTDETLKLMHDEVYNDVTFEMTGKLLELNPELYTIWNFRRDIFINHIFKNFTKNDLSGDNWKDKLITNELEFTLTKQYKFPKCYWIWNHRKWLLLQRPKSTNWDFELNLVDTFFKADSRNYHVWQYRRFVVECMIKYREDIYKESELNFKEFEFTTKMIKKDISNYSSFHNRSKLIEKLFNNPPNISTENKNLYLKSFQDNSKLDFLKAELELITTAFYTDPEDSSVWIYMKWLFNGYFLEDISTDEKIKLIEETINKITELNELEKEDNFGKDNSWCLKTNVYLTKILIVLNENENKDKDKDKDKAIINNIQEIHKQFVNDINRLIELDPMRIKRYQDLLNSVA